LAGSGPAASAATTAAKITNPGLIFNGAVPIAAVVLAVDPVPPVWAGEPVEVVPGPWGEPRNGWVGVSRRR
jgi:hypothetical protein